MIRQYRYFPAGRSPVPVRERTAPAWLALLLLTAILIPAKAGAAGTGQKDPCRALSDETAAAILDADPSALVRADMTIPVSPDDRRAHLYRTPPMSCGFRLKTDFAATIRYMVYQYSQPDKARQSFTTMRDNFAAAARVEDVPGLGEAAFLVPDSRFHRLVAVRDSRLVDVVAPRDPETQKKIIHLVLSR